MMVNVDDTLLLAIPRDTSRIWRALEHEVDHKNLDWTQTSSDILVHAM